MCCRPPAFAQEADSFFVKDVSSTATSRSKYTEVGFAATKTQLFKTLPNTSTTPLLKQGNLWNSMLLVHLDKTKPLKIKRLRGVWSTEGRDRTGTSVTSSVFETDASTDSATSARGFFASNAAAKVRIFLFPASKFRKILEINVRGSGKMPNFAPRNQKPISNVRKICFHFRR